jgi:phasin family protein
MPTPSTFPFLDTDFTKIFADFKVPGFDVETIVAAQRRNIEALQAANQLAIEGAQAVLRRQTEIVRKLVDESTATLKDMLTAGAPEEKIAQQTDVVKKTFESALANLRELAEMVAKSNNEAADILVKRVGEGLTELKTSLQRTKH